MATCVGFIAESNRIEGIHRDPTREEIAEHDRFMELERVTIADMERFVSVFQPDAKLRSRKGMNVRIGTYYPPPGGRSVRSSLITILDVASRSCIPEAAYHTHQAYEALHPFMDGNGRSGRMLWLWQMCGNAPLGFLHTFYYQSLQFSRKS